jgi:hypothetical protein
MTDENSSLPDLPRHVIKNIFDIARLDIDTRIKLKVKPNKIQADEDVIADLEKICKRRIELFSEYGKSSYCLEAFRGSKIEENEENDTCRIFEIFFYDFGDGLRYQIEQTETGLEEYKSKYEEFDNSIVIDATYCYALNLEKTCCFANTGKEISQWIRRSNTYNYRKEDIIDITDIETESEYEDSDNGSEQENSSTDSD